MGGSFRLTARVGPQVTKERYGTLDEALDALQRSLTGVPAGDASVEILGRTYEPVAGRFEIAGPSGLRGGIDVHGDGEAEAFRGWIRRRIIERASGETALEALRRELEA
jgi:hypothetical protein